MKTIKFRCARESFAAMGVVLSRQPFTSATMVEKGKASAATVAGLMRRLHALDALVCTDTMPNEGRGRPLFIYRLRSGVVIELVDARKTKNEAAAAALRAKGDAIRAENAKKVEKAQAAIASGKIAGEKAAEAQKKITAKKKLEKDSARRKAR